MLLVLPESVRPVLSTGAAVVRLAATSMIVWLRGLALARPAHWAAGVGLLPRAEPLGICDVPAQAGRCMDMQLRSP